MCGVCVCACACVHVCACVYSCVRVWVYVNYFSLVHMNEVMPLKLPSFLVDHENQTVAYRIRSHILTPTLPPSFISTFSPHLFLLLVDHMCT